MIEQHKVIATRPCESCKTILLVTTHHRTRRFCSHGCYANSLRGGTTSTRQKQAASEAARRLWSTPEHRARMAKVLAPGASSPSWKGADAKYGAQHMWIYAQRGKASKCSFDPTHVRKMYHWANISGEYKRDVSDYMELCVPCHSRYDRDRRVA